VNANLAAALRLHSLLQDRFWTGSALIGPDDGVRFNRRIWRFLKSYLSFVDWRDDYYFLQAQGYWILSNMKLAALTGDPAFEELANQCAQGVLNAQDATGCWVFPHPGWRGRITTVEGTFAALGLLAHYRTVRRPDLLEGAVRWYNFLLREIGFQEFNGTLAINYFANRTTGLVPNNTTLALAFFGQLAEATGCQAYLDRCPDMIAFLTSVQQASGEFPYVIKNESGQGRTQVHFECCQYHAFELQDLAMYYDSSLDPSVPPMISRIAGFLENGIQMDGSTRFDCRGSAVRKPYNTAAVAAALHIARRLGLADSLEAENRAYRYVLAQQQPDGGFRYSSGDYGVLTDRRYYPRPMSMILYHLLLKASEVSGPPDDHGGVRS